MASTEKHDVVRLRLEKWREEKKKKQDAETKVCNRPAKRFRIGQTPPPVPKSIKKRNPIKSKVDTHWKRRQSMSEEGKTKNTLTTRFKENRNINEQSKKSVSESRRLTTIIKPTESKSDCRTSNTRPALTEKNQISNSKSNNNVRSVLGNRRKTINVSLPNRQQTKPTLKTTKRRNSLRSIKSLNGPKTPVSVTKRPKVTHIDNDVDNELAWRIDTLPPKHVQFMQHQVSTPQSKQTLAHIRHLKEASLRKTTKNWLEANGKTPSKFRHLMCFTEGFPAENENAVQPSKASITIEELTQQQETILKEESIVKKKLDTMFVDIPTPDTSLVQYETINQQLITMLDECFTLFLAGCPVDGIIPWLDRIEKTIPQASHFTPFYICKLNVIKSTGNTKQVLQVIYDAIRNSAKPADKLAEVVKSTMEELIIGRKSESYDHADILKENIFTSSAIKYSVKHVTPFSSAKKRKRSEDRSPRTVITPVRRSTRRSLTILEQCTTYEDPVFCSIEEIPSAERKKALFQTNDAITVEPE